MRGGRLGRGGGRRRPGGLRPIETERVDIGESGEDRERNLASEYMTRNRQRRVRKGSNYVRMCVFTFFLSFIGIARAPQYSHGYYIAWCLSYLTFIICLPSVLPSDNTKIKICLIVCAGNIATISVFCFNRFASKLKAFFLLLDTREERACLCAFPNDPCRWNLCFWCAHGIGSGVMTYLLTSSACQYAPAAALHRFWRSNGYFFIYIALISSIDLSFSYRAGKYDLPIFVAAGRWNIIITIEQAVIGFLCLSQRFKLFMWRFAASSGSISVRDQSPTQQPDTHHLPPLARRSPQLSNERIQQDRRRIDLLRRRQQVARPQQLYAEFTSANQDDNNQTHPTTPHHNTTIASSALPTLHELGDDEPPRLRRRNSPQPSPSSSSSSSASD